MTTDPRLPNNEERIMGAISRAIGLDDAGCTDDAIAELAPLCDEFQNEATLHVYLAWYCRKAARYQEGVAHASAAVRLAPRSSSASLAAFHVFWESGRKVEAVEEIRRFLRVRGRTQRTAEYIDILAKWESP